MKLILLFSASIIGQCAIGQARISIANGSWNDPTIWSPAGVPLFNEDTVIVATDVSFQGNLEVGIDYLILNTSGKLSGSSTFALHGNLLNEGVMNIGRLVVGDGDYVRNNNTILGGSFIPSNPLNENNSVINMDSLIVSDFFVNSASGQIFLDYLLTGDGDVENNGSVVTDSWMNDVTTTGTGSYCIENCFLNSGSILGALDVCDNTPNTGGFMCDLNVGTIGAGVTMCTNSNCVFAELAENTSLVVTVFPNPLSANDPFLYLEIPTGEIVEVVIIDALGRELFRENGISGSVKIERSQLAEGFVFIIVSTDLKSSVSKVVLL